jgi:hypothetical protein
MRNDRPLLAGLVLGAVVAASAGIMMGQGGAQPVKAEIQYFVTGKGDDAHLWVREGAALRCVGHGRCEAHDHGEAGHDEHGHDHENPAGR